MISDMHAAVCEILCGVDEHEHRNITDLYKHNTTAANRLLDRATHDSCRVCIMRPAVDEWDTAFDCLSALHRYHSYSNPT